MLNLRPLATRLTLLIKVIRLLWEASPNLFFIALTLNVVGGQIPLIAIYANSNILALLADAPWHEVQKVELTHKIVWLLVAMGALSLLGVIVDQLIGIVQNLFQIRVTNLVQQKILIKSSGLDITCYENVEFHNKMQNALTEAGGRPFAIVQHLMTMGGAFGTIVSAGTLVLRWKSWLFPVLLVPPIIQLWITSKLAAQNVEMKRERTETVRKAGYLRGLLMGDSVAKELRLFNLSGFFLERVKKISEAIFDQERDFAKRRLLSRGLFTSLMSLNHPFVVGYAAFQCITLKITFKEFSIYSQSVLALQRGLRGVANALAGLYESQLFLVNLFEFLALQPTVESNSLHVNPRVAHSTPELIFENVRFGYRGGGPDVLRGVSFTVAPGERVAIIGENGEGKSTIVKLLAGLYAPNAGKIMLNGVDITTLDRTQLRSRFAFLLQDFVVYNMTVAENIGLGRVDSMHNLGQIEAAAKAAGLESTIAGLPDRYQTVLGRSFSRGHELSGGQRQLIALARALMREAPILVLDEPTAALDVYNESLFFERLLGARPDTRKSVIFISHRMFATKFADRILLLRNGQIIEQGTHEDLMNLGGRYAEMHDRQKQMIRAEV